MKKANKILPLAMAALTLVQAAAAATPRPGIAPPPPAQDPTSLITAQVEDGRVHAYEEAGSVQTGAWLMLMKNMGKSANNEQAEQKMLESLATITRGYPDPQMRALFISEMVEKIKDPEVRAETIKWGLVDESPLVANAAINSLHALNTQDVTNLLTNPTLLNRWPDELEASRQYLQERVLPKLSSQDRAWVETHLGTDQGSVQAVEKAMERTHMSMSDKRIAVKTINEMLEGMKDNPKLAREIWVLGNKIAGKKLDEKIEITDEFLFTNAVTGYLEKLQEKDLTPAGAMAIGGVIGQAIPTDTVIRAIIEDNGRHIHERGIAVTPQEHDHNIFLLRGVVDGHLQANPDVTMDDIELETAGIAGGLVGKSDGFSAAFYTEQQTTVSEMHQDFFNDDTPLERISSKNLQKAIDAVENGAKIDVTQEVEQIMDMGN